MSTTVSNCTECCTRLRIIFSAKKGGGMLRFTLLVILLCCSVLGAYSWSSCGPTGVDILNYNVVSNGEIYSTSTGFYFDNGNGWQSDSYSNLPVKNFREFNGVKLLITGDGTDSDGIYSYDFSTSTFAIQEYVLNPHFLEQQGNTMWVGSDEGLDFSSDGNNWSSVALIGTDSCYDFAAKGDTLVVTSSTYVYKSFDNGVTWSQGQNSGYEIRSITYHSDGILYGIFGGSSWSSGLYSSIDHGETWINEFWSVELTDLYSTMGVIFVCWNQGQSPDIGIAQWDPLMQFLMHMNVNLPQTDINRLSENMMINCPNLIACTTNGAWITTDLSVDSELETVPVPEFNLSNYPNPFNPETTISFTLSNYEKVNVSVFNVLGQKVSSLLNEPLAAGDHQIVWDGTDSNNGSITSGVYFIRLKSNSGFSVRRILLIK